jgi:hypothetical protein
VISQLKTLNKKSLTVVEIRTPSRYSLAQTPTAKSPFISGVAVNNPVVGLMVIPPMMKGFVVEAPAAHVTVVYGGGDAGEGAGSKEVPP